MSTPETSSLQLRVASVFVLLALAFSIGSYLALQWMVLPAFTQLEKEEASKDIVLVKQLINAELDSVAGLARQYSLSTQAYNFLSGKSPDWAEKNIRTADWPSIDIDLMYFFTSSGELVWGKIVDPLRGDVHFIHEWDEKPTSRGREFSRINADLGELKGMAEGRFGILLTALQPVYRSNGLGDSAGFVLMGRIITPARRDEFSERIGVDFSVTPVQDDGQFAASGGVTPAATYYPSQPVAFHYEADSVVTTQRLRDAFNQYVIALEARTPRMISSIGSGIQRLSFAFLTIMSSLFVLLTWLLLRWLVVDPVKKLQIHMSAIRRTGDLSFALDLGRNDELGGLAREFGFMQGALREAHVKVENARDDALSMAKKKSEFLASMSHEIRTPMNGVVGMTELLLNTDLNSAQRHLVDTIKTSSSSLVNVVNDVLDFSQIDTGKIQLAKNTFSLSVLVGELNAIVAESAHRKGLEYITIEHDTIPGGIVADDRRIRQVLVNLVGNAIKFTQEGQVVLSISCERTWWDNEIEKAQIKFSVTDTGVGISAAQREKVLSEFGQADTSSTREFSGTGLGLAISRHLVHRMQGEFGFESEEGAGSEFWFTLPVELNRSADVAECADIDAGDALQGKSILIVDDNATNCEVLKSHTTDWGANAVAVFSGQEALGLLEHELNTGSGFDVVILDSLMPGMSGADLAKRVCADKKYGEPIMVMLSSMAQAMSEQELTALGISCYLAKPVLREDLYLKIARALKEAPLQHAENKFLESSSPNKGSDVKLDADVLVAEDNPVNQQLIDMVLQDFGCRCVLVGNGEEALDELGRRTYDLVIMDCQMPVMDGFEATQKIRELAVLSSAGSRIPIIALTANAMKGDRDRCLQAGMDSYISKPFSSQTLGDAIQALLPDMSEVPSASESKIEVDPETDAEGEAVVIDQESLDRVRQMQREGQPDILTRLIDVYLNSSPDLIGKLESALEANDIAAIELNAHTLKSSSANLGALRYSALCSEAEQAAREGGSKDLEALCRQIISEFEAVCDALRKERKNDQ